ncbi:hypothetical protein EU527_07960 [Candidatus Thorarchaeota archaeon]|nr:MAG: hypothetical protein EU527_07960 [Candidatus Thorarchaeota archaeon]
MAYLSGRRVASGMLPCFGSVAVVLGLMFGYIIPFDDPVVVLAGNLILLIGIAMIISGLALYPSGRRESRKIRSILEIVAARKQVSISDIRAETGLDTEYIRKVITDMLIAHVLFGYLEDDFFVRDIAGGPRYYR